MVEIRKLIESEADEVIELWQNSAGVVFEEWESAQLLVQAMLQPNVISYVAVKNGSIVGAILAGSVGLRGLIQHLAVHQDHRRSGIGQQLVETCLSDLKEQGIGRVFFGVLNPDAIKFWESMGFKHDDAITQMFMDM